MKAIIIAFLIGVLGGGAGTWYLLQKRYDASIGIATEHAAAQQSPANAAHDALAALRLTAEDVQRELDKTGRIVRRQVVGIGAGIADAAHDARVTAAVKTRFATDRELEPYTISVSTTGGTVTLTGTLPSAELIGRAVVLAMGTADVTEVVSTLQVGNVAQ